MHGDAPKDNARMKALWRARELGLRLVAAAPLTLEGDVPIQGGMVRVKIQLSDDFPALPPRVWRQGPNGEDLAGYVGHHTYQDKSLCLFRDSGGEGAWRSEYGLDEVIERLKEQAEGSAAATLGEHGSDLDLPIAGGGKTLIISAAQAAILQAKDAVCGLIEALNPARAGLVVATAVHGLKRNQVATAEFPPHWATPNAPFSFLGFGAQATISAAWCRVPWRPWREIAPDFESALACVLNRAPPSVRAALPLCRALVLVRGAGERDMLVFYRGQLIPQFVAPQTAWAQVADLASAFFARNTPLTAPAIAEAHVALVGLGSLGAPVAILLAQAGVRQFTLFDPDKLQPENLSRYPVGAEGLGHLKVDLVTAKILSHNPWATVSRFSYPPLADQRGLDALKTVLDDPHGLIVCTCADDHVECDLNRLAVAHNRPLIIGAAMGAAEHARILRVLPGESACLECVLLHQRDDPERFPKFKPQKDVGSWAYAGEAIAGLGLDTQEIAAKVARHTLQTLGLRLGGLPYGDAWGDHLLWTRLGGWVFDHPGQTLRVPTTRRPDCEVCHPQAGSSQEDEETLITLLLEEGRG